MHRDDQAKIRETLAGINTGMYGQAELAATLEDLGKERVQDTSVLGGMMESLVELADDEKNTKEEMETSLREILGREKTDYKTFVENYKDYLFTQDKEISDKFDEQNNFQTSVRGVKIRGVYDSRREANVRAKVLQRMDQTFNVFVGQVGYWLPWDPNPDGVEKQEYLNEELNKLVKGYNVNQAEKDMFFEEQKREKKAPYRFFSR